MTDYGVRDVVYFVARRLRCFRGVDKLVSIIFLAQYEPTGDGRIAEVYEIENKEFVRVV